MQSRAGENGETGAVDWFAQSPLPLCLPLWVPLRLKVKYRRAWNLLGYLQKEVEEWREVEFSPRLSSQAQGETERQSVYLDHAGTVLPPSSLIRAHAEYLCSRLHWNPHSMHPSSSSSSSLAVTGTGTGGQDGMETADVRETLLNFFGTTGASYSLVFTSGATESLSLVGRSFRWSGCGESTVGRERDGRAWGDCRKGRRRAERKRQDTCSVFAYTLNNHTSCGVGLRAHAQRSGASVRVIRSFADLEEGATLEEVCGCDCGNVELDGLDSGLSVDEPRVEGEPRPAFHLLAFPGESNFDGTRPDLWRVSRGMKETQKKRPCGCRLFSLLDASKLAGSCPLFLDEWQFDFVVVSFYKIFGYPSGMGALLIRHSAAAALEFWETGGGTVEAVGAGVSGVDVPSASVSVACLTGEPKDGSRGDSPVRQSSRKENFFVAQKLRVVERAEQGTPNFQAKSALMLGLGLVLGRFAGEEETETKIQEEGDECGLSVSRRVVSELRASNSREKVKGRGLVEEEEEEDGAREAAGDAIDISSVGEDERRGSHLSSMGEKSRGSRETSGVNEPGGLYRQEWGGEGSLGKGKKRQEPRAPIPMEGQSDHVENKRVPSASSLANRARRGLSRLSGHASAVTRECYERMKKARHSNGSPVFRIFGFHPDLNRDGQHPPRLSALPLQGPVIVFVALCPDGRAVGSSFLQRLAWTRYGILMRAGCHCNPGGCQGSLGISDAQVEENWRDGYRCGGEKDFDASGRVLTTLRVSFGFSSLLADVDRLEEFWFQEVVDRRRFGDSGGHFVGCRLDDVGAAENAGCGSETKEEKKGCLVELCEKTAELEGGRRIDPRDDVEGEGVGENEEEGGGQRERVGSFSSATFPSTFSEENSREKASKRKSGEGRGKSIEKGEEAEEENLSGEKQRLCAGCVERVSVYPIKGLSGIHPPVWPLSPRSGSLYLDRSFKLVPTSTEKQPEQKETVSSRLEKKKDGQATSRSSRAHASVSPQNRSQRPLAIRTHPELSRVSLTFELKKTYLTHQKARDREDAREREEVEEASAEMNESRSSEVSLHQAPLSLSPSSGVSISLYLRLSLCESRQTSRETAETPQAPQTASPPCDLLVPLPPLPSTLCQLLLSVSSDGGTEDRGEREKKNAQNEERERAGEEKEEAIFETLPAGESNRQSLSSPQHPDKRTSESMLPPCSPAHVHGLPHTTRPDAVNPDSISPSCVHSLFAFLLNREGAGASGKNSDGDGDAGGDFFRCRDGKESDRERRGGRGETEVGGGDLAGGGQIIGGSSVQSLPRGRNEEEVEAERERRRQTVTASSPSDAKVSSWFSSLLGFPAVLVEGEEGEIDQSSQRGDASSSSSSSSSSSFGSSGAFVNKAPLLVVVRESVQKVGEAVGKNLDASRFRANILLGGLPAFSELRWTSVSSSSSSASASPPPSSYPTGPAWGDLMLKLERSGGVSKNLNAHSNAEGRLCLRQSIPRGRGKEGTADEEERAGDGRGVSAESASEGQTVRVCRDLFLQPYESCQRCPTVDVSPHTGRSDARVLRAVADLSQYWTATDGTAPAGAHFGVYCRAVGVVEGQAEFLQAAAEERQIRKREKGETQRKHARAVQLVCVGDSVRVVCQ